MRRLGLIPGATLGDAKTAWRRAASRLHPDRAGQAADHDLAEVNAAFQRLQDFHARHGRLPGAAEQNVRSRSSTKRGLGRRTVIALALGIGAFVLWPQTEPGHTETQIGARQPDSIDTTDWTPVPAPTSRLDKGTPTSAKKIRFGMTAIEVARIAGEPMLRSPERWDYGPSEVRFERGKVIGWHVSPLRPLPVVSEHENEADATGWTIPD